MYKKGFTLIELMVVISIIALFSSIAFASLTNVRARAQEATIKADLKSVKSQAELSFNNVGDYSTASSAVSAIIDGINKAGGTASFYTRVDPNTGTSYYDHYAISARLNSDPTKSWSISDTGGNNVVWNTKDTMKSGAEGGQGMDWTWANKVCANAGGRLPTIEELKALYNAGGMTSSSNFSSVIYWSSNEYSSTEAWIVNMALGGEVNSGLKSWPWYYVRCVH